MAEAVTVDLYVPGARPAEFIPNDNDPSAAEGRTSQLLLADLVSTTVGVPVLAESVEVLLGAVPFCTTEKERLVGANDNVFAGGSNLNLAITGGEARQKMSPTRQNLNINLKSGCFKKEPQLVSIIVY